MQSHSTRKPIYPVGPSIAYIPLSRDMFSLVDWDDAELLCQWNWCVSPRKDIGDFIAIRHQSSPPTTITMHGAILGLNGRMVTPDHIRPISGLDNRHANLRITTACEQAYNRRKRCDCSSGFKGVYKTEDGRWRAVITVLKKKVNLGRFMDKESAAAAYREAALEYHGEFARF